MGTRSRASQWGPPAFALAALLLACAPLRAPAEKRDAAAQDGASSASPPDGSARTQSPVADAGAPVETCATRSVPSMVVACHRRPTTVPGLVRVSDVVVGASHTCAIADGAVFCWGNNLWGALGDGTNAFRAAPVRVKGLVGAAQLAVGSLHSCARLGDGTVRCWGMDIVHVGSAMRTDTRSPVTVPDLIGVRAIASGHTHACALLESGEVRCWGGNAQGQLGHGGMDESPIPRRVPGVGPAVALSAGDDYTCALASDRSARCWGLGGFGGGARVEPPAAIPGASGLAEIAVGAQHICTRSTANGAVECWGANFYGQLGDGTTQPRRLPTPVAGVAGVAQLVVGDSHTCARIADGTVRCWGDNQLGQLGDGTTEDRRTPTLVPGLTGVVHLAAGRARTCAILSDGSLRCWGMEHDDAAKRGATG